MLKSNFKFNKTYQSAMTENYNINYYKLLYAGNSVILRCNAKQIARQVRNIRRNVLPPSSSDKCRYLPKPRCHIPEDTNLRSHRSENLKSHNLLNVYLGMGLPVSTFVLHFPFSADQTEANSEFISRYIFRVENKYLFSFINIHLLCHTLELFPLHACNKS